jgi:hypothetical protein
MKAAATKVVPTTKDMASTAVRRELANKCGEIS